MRFSAGGALFLFAAAVFAFSFDLVSFLHAKWVVLACALPVLAAVTPPNRDALRALSPLILLFAYSVLLHGVIRISGREIEVYRWGIAFAFLLFLAACMHGAVTARQLCAALEWIAGTLSILAWLQFYELINFLLPPVPEYVQPIYGVFGNQNLTASIVAMGFGVCCAAILENKKHRYVRVFLLLLLLSALLLMGSRSASLAAGASLLAVLWSMRDRLRDWASRSASYRSYPLIALTLGVLLLLIWLAPLGREWLRTRSPDDIGWHTRQWIWEGALRVTAEHGVLGGGPGVFAYDSPRALGEAAREGSVSPAVLNEVLTLHPHNEILYGLILFGIPGVLLVGFFAMRGWRRASPAARATLTALGVYGLFNPVLESPVHLLLGMLLLMLPKTEVIASATTKWHGRIMAAGEAAILSLLVTTALVVPSYRLAEARTQYERTGQSLDTVNAYVRATDTIWAYPDAWIELGVLGVQRGDWQMTQTALKAVSGRSDSGEYYMLLGESFDFMGDEIGARAAYREATLRWPGYAPAWLGYAAYLAEDGRDQVLVEAERYLTPGEFDWLAASILEP